MNPLYIEALKGGDVAMYSATPCSPEEALAETNRLRARYRRRQPNSQRLPILEKDVLTQCQALGIDYIA